MKQALLRSVLRLQGALNVSRLERALTEIVRRHEVLRVTFTSVDGVPHQRLHPPSNIAVEVSEVSQPGLEKWLSLRSSQPFNLESGPLLRAHDAMAPEVRVD